MKAVFYLASLLLPGHLAAAQAPAPDIIMTGGKVFTAELAQPYAQALAVRGERIVAVGSTAAITKLAGPDTRRIDLRGRTVVPGFNDAHTHLPPGGPATQNVTFPPANLVQGPASAQVLDTLAALVRRLPEGTLLHAEIGLRALQDPFLRRAELDHVAPKHPVVLHVPWGHGTVANSRALQLMGIGDDDTALLGGTYGRVADSFRLNGLLTEYGEWAGLRTLNGRLPDSTWVRRLREYGAECLRFGLTSVQEMAGSLPPDQAVRVVQAARLPLRHRLVPYYMTMGRAINRREWASVPRQPTPRARVEGVKYILDATPLEGGALMRKAYPGRPGWHGQLNFPADTVRRLLRTALASPQQLLLHLAGDSSTSLVLRLMSELAPDSTWRRKRVRFEHGDGVTPDLHARTRALGIVVVQNPSHYINPALNGQPALPSGVSPSFRSLLEHGVAFALGSDGPSNPFLNILFAITLADEKEALTREQAVRAYTAGAAYAEFQEAEKGTLSVGKLADLAVLSQDIFTVPPPALPGTVSELTMVGGQVVYEAAAGRAPGPAAPPLPSAAPKAPSAKPKQK